MIDIENEVFTSIATAIRAEYPKAYVTGEYTRTPPSFPCISIIEIDNHPLNRSRTTSSVENHAVLTYEVNVYSNKTTGKKSECKAIATLIDNAFASIGFTRLMMNTVLNLEDATIYRIISRYEAIADHNNIIYRKE